MGVVDDNVGGRTVGLFIPFEDNGEQVKEIKLKPFTLGHTLHWSAGDYTTVLELLSNVSGVSQSRLKLLRYPDADRVMAAFIDMLPPEVRQMVVSGQVPVKGQQQEAPQASFAVPEPLEHDDGGGFDIGDEP